jgi:hypothetical protein
MNTIPAQEIKRRGIGAVDDLIAKGAVHIIRNNQPQYVVLSEERYEEFSRPRKRHMRRGCLRRWKMFGPAGFGAFPRQPNSYKHSTLRTKASTPGHK